MPCEKCGATIRVPDSKSLKVQSGDPYPNLRAIDKLRQTAAERIKPFDGKCLVCRSAATVEIPILFAELLEQVIADHGGLRITPTGVNAHIGSAEGIWQSSEIPLMLCDQHALEFESDRPRLWRRVIRSLAIPALIAAITQLVTREILITAIVTPLALLKLLKFRQTGVGQSSQVPAWLSKWIEHVRWFPAAIEDSMSFTIAAGPARPIANF